MKRISFIYFVLFVTALGIADASDGFKKSFLRHGKKRMQKKHISVLAKALILSQIRLGNEIYELTNCKIVI